jgi:two-component system, cell cycle sensor histidine kinase and response regulator CckA
MREQDISRLVAATKGTQDQQFYEAFARTIVELTGVRGAIVGVLDPKRAHPMLANAYGWADNKPLPEFSYELDGTPCKDVMEIGSRIHERGAAELYPRASLLQDLSIESYCGVAVTNGSGAPIGILAAVHNEPKADIYKSRDLLQAFSAYAANEILRQRTTPKAKGAQHNLAPSAVAKNITSELNDLLRNVKRHLLRANYFVEEGSAKQHIAAASESLMIASKITQQLNEQSLESLTDQNVTPSSVDPAAHLRRAIGFVNTKSQTRIPLLIQTSETLPSVLADPEQLFLFFVDLIQHAKSSITEYASDMTIQLSKSPAKSSEYDHCKYRSAAFVPSNEHLAIHFSNTQAPKSQGMLTGLFSQAGQGEDAKLADLHNALNKLKGAGTLEATDPSTPKLSVYLPIGRPAKAVVENNEKPDQTDKLNILVVDDNDIVRSTLCKTLHHQGYEVSDASTGTEALGLIDESTSGFDCMIIDRVMPGLSGPQLIEHIRQQITDVPIILTTGFSGKGDSSMDNEMIDGLLQKPWTAKEVTRIIQQAIIKRQQQ